MSDRYILVLADGSKEMEVALQYACARAKKTGRKIIIASFIKPPDVLTTQGVTEIMRNEAREEAEEKQQVPSQSSRTWQKVQVEPETHEREYRLFCAGELEQMIDLERHSANSLYVS